MDDGVDTDDCAHYNSNRSQSVATGAVNSTQDNMESCYETEITEAHLSRRRSHAYLLFERWARKEKYWVQTFVEFGVTNRLMLRLLKLKKAPIVPITLKRNLIKYSGFETALYKICPGHMLISRLSGSNETETNDNCSVCSEKRMSPNFSTFKYLKILPLVRSWVQNEDSCRLLFE